MLKANSRRYMYPTPRRSKTRTARRSTRLPAVSPPSASTCSLLKLPWRLPGHYQTAGRRTAAAAAATKATTLTAQCEGARTPALELHQPRDLTPRELEIATMAARGLSSKTIAERLVVSVRTVDNTLHQVYGKLAVNNRADLRPLLVGPEALAEGMEHARGEYLADIPTT